MKGWHALAGILVVAWLFVWGRPTPVELALGVFASILVARFLRNLYDVEVSPTRAVRRAPAFLTFVLLFLWDLLKSSLDVVYRVLRPSTVAPAVVEVPLRAEGDYAITLIANRITLTPGTLSADYDDDRGVLMVHHITGAREPAKVRAYVRDLDRTVRGFMGEGP